ncbi:MAG TPA: hypothetical protein VFB66_31340 [Tepidisphaeraceae bacterium]|nr:hypothetical protein [Tepidisphaeraceae bacterium]
MTRMATVVLTFVVLTLAALCQSARAQLRLDAGDAWTHEFTSLPVVITGAGPAERLSGFHFAMSNYELESDLLRVEMFENTVADGEPLCATLLDTYPPGDSCAAAGGWDDLQGTVRLTMLSGSALIESVVIYHQVPTGVNEWTRYESGVIPVPEAGSCSWLAAGTVLALWRRRRNPTAGTARASAGHPGGRSSAGGDGGF